MLPLPMLLPLLAAPAPREAAAPIITELAVTVETASGEARGLTRAGNRFGAARTAAEATAAETPRMRWSARNVDAARGVKDGVLRFTVVRADAAGEQEAESVLGTSLPPRRGVTGGHEAPIEEPGEYRVRLELLTLKEERLQECTVTLRVRGTDRS